MISFHSTDNMMNVFKKKNQYSEKKYFQASKVTFCISKVINAKLIVLEILLWG